MIQRSLKKKLYGALIIMGLLAFIFAGFSWVQAIRTRSFTSQTFIHIPRHFFNQLYHPWQRLSFEIDVLPLSHSPALSLTRGQAVLRPKFWNLAANCPRSSNLEIFDTTLESPAWQLLAELLQHWVVNSAYEAKTLKAPLCQHTVVSIFNSKLHIGASPQQNYLVKRFQLRGGAKPHLVIEGGAQGEHPEELGLNLTYRPDLDQGALSAKLGKRGRFEGKIERFSRYSDALISGLIYWSTSNSFVGAKTPMGLALEGRFTLSADISGPLADSFEFPHRADGLSLEGAVESREGSIKNHNIPLVILRDVAKIPAVAALNRLLEERSLPKIYYTAQTDYEVLSFTVSKEGSSLRVLRILLKHSAYLMAAEASLNLKTQTVQLTGNLVLPEDLSQKIIQYVPEINILASTQGRLSFPFQITGTLQSPSIHADIKQITERLIAVYRDELIRRGQERMEALP